MRPHRARSYAGCADGRARGPERWRQQQRARAASRHFEGFKKSIAQRVRSLHSIWVLPEIAGPELKIVHAHLGQLNYQDRLQKFQEFVAPFVDILKK